MTGKNLKSLMGMTAAALVVILTTLTITCFAVLTFVSANNEYHLSEKSRTAAVQYYKADARANELLVDICQAVKNGNIQDIAAKKGYNVTKTNQWNLVSYQVPVNKSKMLQVEAAISASAQVKILKWETENQ